MIDVERIEAGGTIADRILARRYCRDSQRLTMAVCIEVQSRAIAALVVELDKLGDGPRLFSEGRPVPGAAACKLRTP